jgi:hypothetical protein
MLAKSTETSLLRYVARVVSYERESREQFAVPYRTNVTAHPITFFGDVTRAKVLTVGINPSWTEFVNGRWPSTVTTEELTHRLVTYFVSILRTFPHPVSQNYPHRQHTGERRVTLVSRTVFVERLPWA